MPHRDWIFQAIPDEFDFEGFIAARPEGALWRASRQALAMSPGDRVYLWHGKGSDRRKSAGRAGIVGRGLIAGPVEHRADDSPAARFWTDPGQAAGVVDRIPIRIESLSARAVIDYDDLFADPVFGGHAIVTARTGTNFSLDEPRAERLAALWDHAAIPLSDDERLAALHAAVEGLGAAWLSARLPRTVSRCRRATSDADPANALRYGVAAGSAERALWERYLGTAGAGRAALKDDFARAWAEPEAAPPRP